jgi:hypothetical protein
MTEQQNQSEPKSISRMHTLPLYTRSEYKGAIPKMVYPGMYFPKPAGRLSKPQAVAIVMQTMVGDCNVFFPPISRFRGQAFDTQMEVMRNVEGLAVLEDKNYFYLLAEEDAKQFATWRQTGD